MWISLMLVSFTIWCSQAGNKKDEVESETAFRRALAIDLFQGLFLNICCTWFLLHLSNYLAKNWTNSRGVISLVNLRLVSMIWIRGKNPCSWKFHGFNLYVFCCPNGVIYSSASVNCCYMTACIHVYIR